MLDFDGACIEAKDFLNKLAINGTLFTDSIKYDLAHRAAGRDEGTLHTDLDYVHRYIKRFSDAERNWYMKQNLPMKNCKAEEDHPMAATA